MAKGAKPYAVGRGKPPRKTRFTAGKSGNPKGRPKGSKNFATVIAKELRGKVPITENGRSRKVSKQEVIAKQMVNQAAGGNLKAAQALLNETRHHDPDSSAGPDLTALDGQHDELVIAELIRRIRSMDEGPPLQPTDALDNSSKTLPNPKRKELKK